MQLEINKIKDLFKKIYVNVPNRYRNAFGEKLAFDNLERLRAFSFIITILSPFAIFAHYQIYSQGFCDKNLIYCESLFITHYVGIVFSIIVFSLYKLMQKYLHQKSMIHNLIFIFIGIYFFLFSASSISSQFYTGNIVFFSTGSVLLASLFVTFKRYTSILYFIVLSLFLIGIHLFQNNPELRLVNFLNSVLSMFLAYSLNLVLFHYKLESFMKSKKIETKSTELDQTFLAIKKDIAVAKRIQSQLIQKNFKSIKHPLNFELAYIPLDEVGGDIYDIAEINKHTIRIFLADATGHGIQAALITMVIKAEYESLKMNMRTPKKLLRELNHNFSNKFSSLNSFFSCIVVDIQPEKNRIIYSSAGHPDQLIQMKNWDLKPLPRTGKIMGIHKESEYEEVEVQFEKGDKLFLFTDGLFEEFNHEKKEFGEEQLANIIKAYSDKDIKELFKELMNDLDNFLESDKKQDDISFIGVEYL